MTDTTPRPEDEAQKLQDALDAAGLPWSVFPVLQMRETLYRAERRATQKHEVLHASPRVLRRLVEEAEARITDKPVAVNTGALGTSTR